MHRTRFFNSCSSRSDSRPLDDRGKVIKDGKSRRAYVWCTGWWRHRIPFQDGSNEVSLPFPNNRGKKKGKGKEGRKDENDCCVDGQTAPEAPTEGRRGKQASASGACVCTYARGRKLPRAAREQREAHQKTKKIWKKREKKEEEESSSESSEEGADAQERKGEGSLLQHIPLSVFFSSGSPQAMSPSTVLPPFAGSSHRRAL